MEALAGVVRGEWVVKCPFCGICERRESGEWHFCRACCNANNDYRAVLIVWPAPSDRAQIERLLANRKWSWVRNWIPPESVDDLRDENLKFGMAVD